MQENNVNLLSANWRPFCVGPNVYIVQGDAGLDWRSYISE